VFVLPLLQKKARRQGVVGVVVCWVVVLLCAMIARLRETPRMKREEPCIQILIFIELCETSAIKAPAPR
jgi:hypothetical protein